MNLPFLTRRASTQAGLLAAVLAVVVVGTTLLGTCALLLTTAQDRAQHAALLRTPADQLDVEVVLTDLGADPVAATTAAAAVLADALAPLGSTTSTWATGPVRDLPASADGARRLGYLAGIDDLPDRARLDSGHWPVAPTGPGPAQAVLPSTTAGLLGIGLGDEVRLGPSLEPTDPGDTDPVTVLVVGTFTPGAEGWDRDLLGGAGSTPEFAYGVFQRVLLPAYGPFVVAPPTMLGSTGGVARVSLLGTPLVGTATPDALAEARDRVVAARTAVRTALAGGDTTSRVDARLPGTVELIATQQAVTRSGVLVVALVGLSLAGTALGLAGRLVTGRRAAERALLTARGARPGQLVAQAAGESVVLALVAGAAAVPLSELLFGAVTRLPLLARAGFSGDGQVTPALTSTVAAGALVLAACLVAPSLRPAGATPGRRRSRGAVIRSGADLVLAALAVLGWLQLRGRPATAPGVVDPVLTLAPVLFLLAGAVLALRALPLLSHVAEHTARRSHRLVLPLAAWQLARRPHATGVAFLLVLATAAATFGVASTSTWRTSQTEQADARVGAAVTVVARSAAPVGQGAEAAAAIGGTVSPVADQPVALGSVVRTADGTATRLLAVDTGRAAELLRGRLPAGATWAGLTSGLAVEGAASALRVPASAGGLTLTVRGSTDDGVLGARPTVLVEDSSGSRVPLTGEEVVLDGQPHAVALHGPAGDAAVAEDGLTVVAVDLDLRLTDQAGRSPGGGGDAGLAVSVQVTRATADAPVRWTVGPPPDDRGAPIEHGEAALTADGVLTVQASVSLSYLSFGDVRLVSAAAPAPAALPVLVSQDLADASDSAPGDRLTLTVGPRTLRAEVAGVVPYVPSLPGAPAVLADYAALAQALTAAGSTEPLTTGWWSGHVDDPAGVTARLTDAGLPGAVTAAGLGAELRAGPLRVGLIAALWLLVTAAGALALTGTALHSAAALDTRAVEVARLQGLGVPRRAVAGAQLLEHGAVTTLAVVLGAAVGAAAAWLLAPLMTVSESGAEPVPAPLPQWPWSTESLVVAGLIVGCAAIALPVAGALGRRATAAHLRLDGGS